MALLPSFLSADRPELYPQSYPTQAASASCIQRLVCEPTSNRRIHKTVKTVRHVPLHIAIVQAKRELIYIASKVIIARMVIDTM